MIEDMHYKFKSFGLIVDGSAGVFLTKRQLLRIKVYLHQFWKKS